MPQLSALFDAIAQTPNHHFLLQIGFSEIYNEKVYDLLDQSKKKCRVQEPRGDGIFVIGGQTKIFATTVEQVLNFFSAGNKKRFTAETKHNPLSSRSHAPFQFFIETKNTKKSNNNQIPFTKK